MTQEQIDFLSKYTPAGNGEGISHCSNEEVRNSIAEQAEGIVKGYYTFLVKFHNAPETVTDSEKTETVINYLKKQVL